MADLQRLNISCNLTRTPAPLRPLCDPPLICLGLLAAPVALVFWLWGNLHLPPLPDGAPDPDQIPAIPEDADEAEVADAAIPKPSRTAPAGRLEQRQTRSNPGCGCTHFRRYPSIRFQEAAGADSTDMIKGGSGDAASVAAGRQALVHATFDRRAFLVLIFLNAIFTLGHVQRYNCLHRRSVESQLPTLEFNACRWPYLKDRLFLKLSWSTLKGSLFLKLFKF